MAVPLHRLERAEHGDGVGQPFAGRIEPDVGRHAAREPRELEREEFVEVDGLEQPVVERAQHLGRNERDAEGAPARLQVLDGGQGDGGVHGRAVRT
ncbi:hypothetical protein D9M68_987710 [compost metagenome]